MKKAGVFKGEAGFTLVEIMIALFILSVGILGVIGMFTTSMKANQLGRTTTVGNRLAQNIMEQVKTTTNNLFTNMSSSGGTFGIHSLGAPIQSSVTNVNGNPLWTQNSFERGGKFTETSSPNLNFNNYSAILKRVTDAPLIGIDTYTVRVKWNDRWGLHETKLITYMDSL